MTDIINEETFKKLKKKKDKKDKLGGELDEESGDMYEYDEDSDIQVHEKFTKQKKIRNAKN